ncbi:16S rRNA (adenine(1518)-N(6)/adenine(1519)-N(6))-dimethyltransferase RsmA [Dictyobacter aurantiacus]|uniref:Ribosomal RNA small subunit methyltransferase A n=1 Tax=Dictyobacter aurantiacus TaxID=1936993 RepID=A0A401ZDN4_9CHLR|nr:16S rRNA (adenine(1518)-N(6)/adenine(1519)-N(6))-dimethyltransferase RsmA [Dictyobacter aurantiacus]GCE04994.1 ribosomal RNA small subunit methyltransferase A [Dictyobacter aurantiacus]
MTDNNIQNAQPIQPAVIDMIDLTNVRELKNLLATHGMRPNKSFGQNFLIDRNILKKIVQAAEIMPEDEVLEVGAGTGVLTRELAQRARRVVAVEIERDMLTLLAQTTRRHPNVELIARNLLFLNPSEVFGQTPYKLVANLPYYITAPTFRHFLENPNPPRTLVVMVQWEVAQRIIAEPGDLSLLAISVQFYGRPHIIARVPAQSFYPAPKVDSAILRIDVHEQAPLSHEERDRFFKVVQAGFSEKRKQLHNSLTHGLHYKNELIRNWMSEASIDSSRRAETLSIEEWIRLWRTIDQATRTDTQAPQ